MSAAIPHPYYPIFLPNKIESYPERVFGMIEKIQVLFQKLMGKWGATQKHNYSETVYMSPREWKIIKQRFRQDSFCLSHYQGASTLHRYGNYLCQETMKRSKVKKEIITIENSEMFAQLISAFGKCVCSTVRERFPRGPRLRRGMTQDQAVNNLNIHSHVNSLIELSGVNKENSEVNYSIRKSTRGVDMRYDPFSKKFTLAIRYSKFATTADIIKNFYSNNGDIEYDTSVRQPRNNPCPAINNPVPDVLNKEFEAYDTLFVVTQVNSDNVSCKVIEQSENHSQYLYDSVYNFDIVFVRNKINDYLQ